MESTRSSNQISEKPKQKARTTKIEEKLLTLNDTVMGRNYFTLGKFLKNEYNSCSGCKRKISCFSPNKRVLVNSDETVSYGCDNNINQTKTLKGVAPSLLCSERYCERKSDFVDVVRSNEVELKNYKSNDNFFKSKLTEENSQVKKTFKKIVSRIYKKKSLYYNQQLEQEINEILGKMNKRDQKFSLAVNNDLNQQREKFLEMKNFKIEEQLTQSNIILI